MNGHPAYKAILDRMWELHDSKAKDYGSTGDPLANLRNGERFGMPAWKRCLVEADSAFYRLENYCNGRNPSLESAKNALMDTAAFALLSLLFLEEEEDARHSEVADAQFEFEKAERDGTPLLDRPPSHREILDEYLSEKWGPIEVPHDFKTSDVLLASHTGYRPPSEEIGKRMVETLEKAK